MPSSLKIPDAIASRSSYKKKFTYLDLYRTWVLLPVAISRFVANKKHQWVSSQFLERLQLAVTEVNACPACSYAHTYLALKEGLSAEEINSFLSGDGKWVKPEEAKALMFAQHFAEYGGCPGEDAIEVLEAEYGKKEADIMISAVQLMLAGNIFGLPYSAFQSRLKGKPYQGSSVFYELSMQLAAFLFVPIAFLHGGLRRLFGLPNRITGKFSTEEE